MRTLTLIVVTLNEFECFHMHSHGYGVKINKQIPRSFSYFDKIRIIVIFSLLVKFLKNSVKYLDVTMEIIQHYIKYKCALLFHFLIFSLQFLYLCVLTQLLSFISKSRFSLRIFGPEDESSDVWILVELPKAAWRLIFIPECEYLN